MAKARSIESLLAGLVDASGNPLASGKVYSYEVGTTTPKSLYSDEEASSATANPLILGANGTSQAYGYGSYKLVVKTSADVTVATWDDLRFTADIQTWTPSYAASGTMTAAVGTLSQAIYWQDGDVVHFNLATTLTIGGVVSTEVYFSLPVTANGTNTSFSCGRADLGGGGVAYLRSSTQGTVQRYDLGNWNSGAGRYLYVSGSYKI